MACSRFEYVKTFERQDRLLPGCWAVIRLDGRSFTSFAQKHHFHKPNDLRALNLCNASARHVLHVFDDHLAFAFGESDEFSFVLKRQSALFARRESKILSTVVSLFSAAYVTFWPKVMDGKELECIPSFDGRLVLYPTTKHLRDYLAWRQADTHVNNLFNTAFWALVQKGGKTVQEAEALLKSTSSAEKNELLFSQFGINYNEEPVMFRKGSFIFKHPDWITGGDLGAKKRRLADNQIQSAGHKVQKSWAGNAEAYDDGNSKFVISHVDVIGDKFWDEHPYLLAPNDLQPPRIPKLDGR